MSFHIKKSEFEQASEAWDKMLDVLKKEGENQVATVNNMLSTNWTGRTAEMTSDLTGRFMQSGVFGQAYDMTEKMCQAFHDALPKMNALMKRCENLSEYLMEDDYEETIFEEIEEGLFNDGDLTINEEYLTSFNAACDDVCTNAEAGRDIIQRMMDKCGGLVDFGSDRDALEASYKKLCRVGNYKAAMNRYVTAVSEFDRNLADRFIAIRSEDNDQENKEWTDINEELAFRADTVMSPTPVANMRKLSGSSILPVSEENNAISSATASYAGMMRADYDRNKNVDTMFTQCSNFTRGQYVAANNLYDKIEPVTSVDTSFAEYIISTYPNISNELKQLIRTMLVQDIQGVYGFEEYLLKEPDSLTDTEIQALGMIYKTTYNNVALTQDSTMCADKVEILEHFTSNLFMQEKEIEYLYMGVEVPHLYIVPNQVLIEKLSMNMNANQDTLASASLDAITSISRYEIHDNWFKHNYFEDINSIQEIYNSQLASVDITLTNLGMNMEIMYYPEASARDKYKDKGIFTLYVNGIDRAYSYVENLPTDMITRMQGLGYQKRDIVLLLAQAESQEDEKFWDSIVQNDYVIQSMADIECYWNRCDGYFEGEWQEEPAKLVEAVFMLKKQLVLEGDTIYLGNLSGREIAVLQILSNTDSKNADLADLKQSISQILNMEGVSYPNEATAINGEVLDTLIKYYAEGAGIQSFENKVAKLMEFGGSSHLVPNTFNPNAFQDVLISTDLAEINSFWERKDGYFAGKWWQDERKLAYAAAVLEHEAELRGQIAINESPLQYYNKGKQDNRLITVQALSMSNVTQTYSPDTAANLEYIFHSQGITDINNITAEGVEALKKYYDSVPEYSKSIDRAMTSTAGQYFQKCAEMMILGVYMRYGEFLMQPSAIALDEAEAVLAGEEIGLESTTGTFVMESSGTGTGTAYLNLTENAEFFSQYSMITEQDMLALQEMPMYGFTMEGAAELIPIEEQAVLNTWGALTNNVGSINNVIETSYGKSIEISEQKMYQVGEHFNKHGREMGYLGKKEYEQAARSFFEQNKSSCEIYEGIFNNSRGNQSGQVQYILRQDGKQLIINKESGQIIDFYNGTSLDAFINVERLQ